MDIVKPMPCISTALSIFSLSLSLSTDVNGIVISIEAQAFAFRQVCMA